MSDGISWDQDEKILAVSAESWSVDEFRALLDTAPEGARVVFEINDEGATLKIVGPLAPVGSSV